MRLVPTVEVIDLTPELAQQFLNDQAPNRRIKATKVDQFARDMESGNWMMTGEAIKFDADDRMIDGQNRCLAVVKSGATIQVLKVSDLALNAQSVMDSGTPRNVRDALGFAGFADAKDIAASVTVHRAWRMGAFAHCKSGIAYGNRPTNSEMVAYAESHPELVEAARRAKVIYGHGLKLPIGAVATVMAETERIDADESADFFDRITYLRTSGAGDPIHTLLKRVESVRSSGQRVEPSMTLYLLFRAWNAFRTGESITKFPLGAPAREQGAKATWAPIPVPR